jgi:hypothetical protein
MTSSTIIRDLQRHVPVYRSGVLSCPYILNAGIAQLDSGREYRESQVVARILDIVFRRNKAEPPVPLCPDHKVEMQLRGKFGRPSRFSDMTQETYNLIYFCPVPGCDHSREVPQVRAQIPVPGAPPARPDFSRRGN